MQKKHFISIESYDTNFVESNRIEFVFLSLKLRGGLFKFLGNGTVETLMHLIIRCYSKFMKLKFIGS